MHSPVTMIARMIVSRRVFRYTGVSKIRVYASNVNENGSNPTGVRCQSETSTIISSGAIRNRMSQMLPGAIQASVASGERAGPLVACTARATSGEPSDSASATSARASSSAW